MTKFYGAESENNADYVIELTDIEGTSAVSNDDTELESNLMSIVEEYPSQPFYVISGEELERSRITKESLPDPVYWNEDLPIGRFHADNNSTLYVTYTASDNIGVEAGTSIGGIFKISGSRERTLGSTSQYAAFSASSSRAQERIYYTGARFEKYYTIDSRTRLVMTHYTLNTITGGTFTRNSTNCYLCKADWDNAWTDYGRMGK